jgi:hypothetical protein
MLKLTDEPKLFEHYKVYGDKSENWFNYAFRVGN